MNNSPHPLTEAEWNEVISLREVQETWGLDDDADPVDFASLVYGARFNFVSGGPGYIGDLYILQGNAISCTSEMSGHNPDVSTVKLVINTGDQPVHGQKFSMTVSPNSGFYGRAELRIVAPSEEVYTPFLFPILRPIPLDSVRKVEKNAEEDNIREGIALFAPMLPPNSGPFTLIFSELLKDAMMPLRQGREDSLWISELVRAAGNVKRMDLVLILPKSFGDVTMFSHKDSLNKGSLVQVGDYDDMVPPGFTVRVWRCFNADPKGPFAVSLIKPV